MPSIIKPKSLLKSLKYILNKPKKPLDENSKKIFKKIIFERKLKSIGDLLEYMSPMARKITFSSGVALFGGGLLYKSGLTKPIFPEVFSKTPLNEKHYKYRKAQEKLEKIIKEQDNPFKMVAITGISGSGKTELAKKYYNKLQKDIEKLTYFKLFLNPFYWKYIPYVYNNSGKKQIFFLFNSENSETLLQSKEELIRNFEPEFSRYDNESIEKYEKRLNAHMEKYLKGSNCFFIYDNVNGKNIKDYQLSLQQEKTKMIIFTSTDQNILNEYGYGKNFSINNGLEEDEAVELLRELSGDKNPTSQKNAEELVTVLGRLPLAISSAGIYISSYKNNHGKKINFSDYNELLKNSDPSFISEEHNYRQGLLYEKTQNEAIYLLLNSTEPKLLDIIKFICLGGGRFKEELVEKYHREVNGSNEKLDNVIRRQSLISGTTNGYEINTVTKNQAQKIINLEKSKIPLSKILNIFISHIENSDNTVEATKASNLFYKPTFYFVERSNRFIDLHLNFCSLREMLKDCYFPEEFCIYFGNFYVHFERGVINNNDKNLMKFSIDLYKLAISKKISIEMEVAAKSNLGLAYAYRHQLYKDSKEEEEMLSALRFSLDYNKRQKNDVFRAVDYIRFSVAYGNSKKPLKSKRACEKVISLFSSDTITDPIILELKAKAYHNIGNFYLSTDEPHLRDVKEAQAYILKAIAIMMNKSIFKKYSCVDVFVTNLVNAYLGFNGTKRNDYEDIDQSILQKIINLYQEHYDEAKKDYSEDHYMVLFYKENLDIAKKFLLPTGIKARSSPAAPVESSGSSLGTSVSLAAPVESSGSSLGTSVSPAAPVESSDSSLGSSVSPAAPVKPSGSSLGTSASPAALVESSGSSLGTPVSPVASVESSSSSLGTSVSLVAPLPSSSSSTNERVPEKPILYWFTRITGAAVCCVGLYKTYGRPR